MGVEKQAIQLKPEQLKKLQMEMLEILIEFDRICQKHNIKYFLSGGTLLGAVRHKGFIPWDDDVDVEMLRHEYERFCEVCEQEFSQSNFFFQNHKNDPFYNWTYGKVRRKNTGYIRVGQEHINQKTGICIDVFPLDNISRNFFIQRITDLGTRICRKILWAKVGYKVEKNKFKKIMYRMLKVINRDFTMRIFETLVYHNKNEKTGLLVFNSMNSRSKRGYTLKKEWFEQSVDLEFEGTRFPVPIGYKDILYFWYDNYMKYPPKEEQVPHTVASYISFSDGTELKS